MYVCVCMCVYVCMCMYGMCEYVCVYVCDYKCACMCVCYINNCSSTEGLCTFSAASVGMYTSFQLGFTHLQCRRIGWRWTIVNGMCGAWCVVVGCVGCAGVRRRSPFHTYTHPSIHTSIHPSIHTCMHTHVHTYTHISLIFFSTHLYLQRTIRFGCMYDCMFVWA